MAFVVQEKARPRSASLAERVAGMLVSPYARAILETFTDGPIRFRLAWSGRGKQRRATWDAALAVQRLWPDLINDPTDSVWEAIVHELADGSLRVELVPRAEDPRFSYRVADVPAASHPTIAATLARMAGARADDVVWDPFVGSGLELCERSLRGPYARLVGTDVDREALERARQNLDSAGAERFDLVRSDARAALLPPLTTMITNPPMGRRVARGTDLDELLRAVIEKASASMMAEGRCVLVSPRPRTTRAAARSAGLTLVASHVIDMGGFDAELQRFDKASDRR
jgi:predicted RNA methylase